MDFVRKEFDVNIPIENKKWNIGLIVGASGTGKTTIAKTVFNDFEFFTGFEWGNNSIIDDFGDFSAKEIAEILSKVGFSSPPDWLKPFDVLSNGQKMRAEIARLILNCDKPVIYDEFTSVVDRQVAKIGSTAIQKFIREKDKQFIAVSCHYDIEDWLNPDWIFDCNKMEFIWRSLRRRPSIECKIRKAEQKEWREFMDFHYLSHEHNAAAHKYICEINDESVAWCSVLNYPHPIVKNMVRIHRIVVKPDYQGIGIGSKFISEIAEKYKKNGKRVTLVTSAPAFVLGLQSNKNWIMTRKPSRTAKLGKTSSTKMKVSADRLTATFEYVKNVNHDTN